MKKTKIAGICLIVLILAAFVSVPVYIIYCAYNVEKMLCETPLPEQTELIEAISQTGKLTGNGKIEHKALQFSEEIEDSGYYIVYSWGSGNSLLKELDIRGH